MRNLNRLYTLLQNFFFLVARFQGINLPSSELHAMGQIPYFLMTKQKQNYHKSEKLTQTRVLSHKSNVIKNIKLHTTKQGTIKHLQRVNISPTKTPVNTVNC